MNLAYFLKPKSMITYLFEDYSLRKGLGKLRESGFASLPVLSREGKYVGIVSEGDFLWYLADGKQHMENLHMAKIRDILRVDKVSAVLVTTSLEEVLALSAKQNFVPVVDDCGSFIGIVRRGDMIRYFAKALEEGKSHLAACIVKKAKN